MKFTERSTGRKYVLVRKFSSKGTHLEASTGRRYTPVVRYV
jgi:hypothetical protein